MLKPKIIEILSDFEYTIKDIFDYMINNINPIISESFGNFKPLEKKVIKLYSNYSLEQKKKMLDFYEEIYSLETENISTFNIQIINKVNTMNKHINFFLFGQNKAKEIKKCCLSFCKKVKELVPLENLGPLGQIGSNCFDNIFNSINENTNNNIVNNNAQNNENNNDLELSNYVSLSSSESIEDNLQKENEKHEKKEDKNNNKQLNNIKEKNIKSKKERKEELVNKEDKVISTIKDLTQEVVDNKNFGDIVKNKYLKYSELLQSIIQIIYNYEKEKKARNFDHDEAIGRIKIAYRPQEIETFDEKLINDEFLNK